jgi:hypothetical protein
VAASRLRSRLAAAVLVDDAPAEGPDAAVSSFYEFLIASEGCGGRDNPIVKASTAASAQDETRQHG